MDEKVKKVIEALVLRKEPVLVREGEAELDRLTAFIKEVDRVMRRKFNYGLDAFAVGEIYTNAVDDHEVIIRINEDSADTGYNVILV